jgi:hypothetical protein
MSIYQRSVVGTLRNRLRDVARTFAGEPPTPEETRLGLELVLKARKELAGGQADLLRLLGPTAAADALGDAERVAAYAESLAVEAMISEAAGQTGRAEAMRRQAVAIAREAQRRAAGPDSEVERLIAQGGRLDLAGGSP